MAKCDICFCKINGEGGLAYALNESVNPTKTRQIPSQDAPFLEKLEEWLESEIDKKEIATKQKNRCSNEKKEA